MVAVIERQAKAKVSCKVQILTHNKGKEIKNMKYYVLEVTTTSTGTAKLVTEKETLNEGIMLFHQVLASSRANPNVTEALCMVINSNGGIEKNEHYLVAEESEEI